MNSKYKLSILIIFFCQFYFSTSNIEAYDRYQATRYANKWWDARNNGGAEIREEEYPFHDYGDYDCANFVSQCMIAGGFNLHNDGEVDDRHSIPYCDNLHDYLDFLEYFGDVTYETRSYVDGTEVAPSNMESGDVIIFGDSSDPWRHAVIVVGGSGNSIYCNAHSNNRYQEYWTF